MDIINIVILLILLVIVGSACFYIVKAKRSGVKCIGCPQGGTCSSKHSGTTECTCGCHSEKNK